MIWNGNLCRDEHLSSWCGPVLAGSAPDFPLHLRVDYGVPWKVQGRKLILRNANNK